MALTDIHTIFIVKVNFDFKYLGRS